MASPDRAPSSISVALLLTHGRSNRLFVTEQNINNERTIGLIAGGVDLLDPNPFAAAVREATEEAKLDPETIIFVKGRNSLEPHVVFVNGLDKIRLGLVYDATYSGPKVSLEGWEIQGDKKVDHVKLFTWRQVITLLENPDQIYRAEFNIPQFLRWIFFDYGGNQSRTETINNWLARNEKNFPGLQQKPDPKTESINDVWEYTPPYQEWTTVDGLLGRPNKTNFARKRSKWQIN